MIAIDEHKAQKAKDIKNLPKDWREWKWILTQGLIIDKLKDELMDKLINIEPKIGDLGNIVAAILKRNFINLKQEYQTTDEQMKNLSLSVSEHWG